MRFQRSLQLNFINWNSSTCWFWVFKKIWDTDKKSPLIFFIHTGGYSLLRFGLEYIRADKEGVTMFGMSNLQMALLLYGLFTIGYATKYFLNKRPKKGHK